MAGIISQAINVITSNPMGSIVFFGIGFLIGFIYRFAEYGI